jgi:hypothetical protein
MENKRYKTSNPAQRKGGDAMRWWAGWFKRPRGSYNTTSLDKRLKAGIAIYPVTGCHVWTGNTWGKRNSKSGHENNRYGTIGVGTHRLAWELANGPIPDGMQVLHKCDNPRCCNPDHLFLGTQQVNMADMARKGRARNRFTATKAPRRRPSPRQTKSSLRSKDRSSVVDRAADSMPGSSRQAELPDVS